MEITHKESLLCADKHLYFIFVKDALLKISTEKPDNIYLIIC